MNQAFHLYRLQQIDTQIDQISASLAELDRLLGDDDQVRSARQTAEENAKLLLQDQNRLKQAEFAVKEQQIKINQTESTLYSGKVRNPKELQDLQKDIGSLKKHLNTLEDHQLDAMLAVEQRQEEEKTVRDQLLKAQAAFTEKSAAWRGQREILARSMERLNAEKATVLPPIDPGFLRAYETMRKRKSGVAVTTVKDSSCSVCGANIRPMELQSARSAQDLVYCSSCGRILYVG